MLDLFQKTISEIVEFKGIGLHSGLESTVRITPADENHGIIFKRTDLEENNIVCSEQIGFKKHCRTSDHILTLKCLIDKAFKLSKSLYVCFIDFKKTLKQLIEKYYCINCPFIIYQAVFSIF